MKTFEVPVQENGRMVLPLDLRRRLGLDRGGRLVIEADEVGIALTTARARRRRAQEIARKYVRPGEGSIVDAFLAEKREEAWREIAEIEGPGGEDGPASDGEPGDDPGGEGTGDGSPKHAGRTREGGA